jgi:hypothetical protein
MYTYVYIRKTTTSVCLLQTENGSLFPLVGKRIDKRQSIFAVSADMPINANHTILTKTRLVE